MDNILYRKNENGITITGIENRCQEINIPEKIQGLDVTEIESYAFYIENELDENESIKRIYIPDTVTKIGEYAFCGCKYLEFIHLPSNLISISNHMFSGCESLEDISIPKGVLHTEAYAFHNCRNLKKVIIPEGCKSVDSYAFYNCRNLFEVSLPKSIESIGTGLFLNCIRLKYLSFGRYFKIADIIAPLTQELHITIQYDDGQIAKVLVPDFQYEYIEHTPARIFQQVNYGTGHIFHQCIGNSGIDFRQYDSCFYLTKREDEDIMVLLLAMYRLEYPYRLTEDKKQVYLSYIKENVEFATRYYISKNDLDSIKFLASLNVFDENNIDRIVDLCVKSNSTEITSFVMDYRHRNFDKPKKKTFDL